MAEADGSPGAPAPYQASERTRLEVDLLLDGSSEQVSASEPPVGRASAVEHAGEPVARSHDDRTGQDPSHPPEPGR